MRVFFFLKNIVSRRQEKQNTEDTFKNQIFFDARNFLEAAKFFWNDILKKKKNTHPNLAEVLVKKF